MACMPLFSRNVRASLWETNFALLDRLPRRSSRVLPQHLLTGRAGEEAAMFYLRRNGFIVIAHDWQSGRAPGDLDLVAWESETLCFIEVKTRSHRGMASAEAAVDGHKRKTLRRLAGHYLRQLPADTATRFDVISVYLQANHPPQKADIELFRNAFSWDE